MRDESSSLSEKMLSRVAEAVDAAPTGAVELDGGEVGSVHRIRFRSRPPVAVKLSEVPLEIEARMLEHLDRQSPLPVPTVFHADPDLLVLEYVDGDGAFTAAAERDAARCLAALHETTADAFGFPFETLSGPYRQPNPWTVSWIEFFREHRLRHFAEAASDEGTLPSSYRRRIDALAGRLPDLLIEPDDASLVHGDFHGGNMIFRDGRVKAVLDPAIYFGHDEIDLAYVDRIDAFGDRFFEHYADHRPIREGFFETRTHVYAAFHALENVRFFGTGRLDRLDTALSRVGL
jgi:fructosamine-3-kinase